MEPGMKLFEIRDEQSRVVAFEIDNALISRRRVARIVETIEGARITLCPRFFSWPKAIFCRFEIDGTSFCVEEPFGDSSRYWVGGDPPGWHPAFSEIVKAFEGA
jgi:hypothetical protein